MPVILQYTCGYRSEKRSTENVTKINTSALREVCKEMGLFALRHDLETVLSVESRPF